MTKSRFSVDSLRIDRNEPVFIRQEFQIFPIRRRIRSWVIEYLADHAWGLQGLGLMEVGLLPVIGRVRLLGGGREGEREETVYVVVRIMVGKIANQNCFKVFALLECGDKTDKTKITCR